MRSAVSEAEMRKSIVPALGSMADKRRGALGKR
jgi:hypothetical protein